MWVPDSIVDSSISTAAFLPETSQIYGLWIGEEVFPLNWQGRRVLEPPRLSVVIPAFDEEGNLNFLYDEIAGTLSGAIESWEIVLVDDGSRDATWEVIQQLNLKDSRVRGLRLSRNFGHQFALLAGLRHARGLAVVTMDADLQHPPQVIPALLEEWRRGAKIVRTVRIDHLEISAVKKFTSQAFYRVYSFLSGEKLAAGVADFRLLDRQVVNELLKLREDRLFMRGLVHWLGFPSSKVEFRCRQRFSGRTKYSFRRMVSFAWSAITAFSLVPLRMAIIIGLISSAAAFLIGLYAVWAKLFTTRTVPGWTTTVSVISFLFGVLFLQLGIVGEYIGRILEEVRGRPRYIVSERVGFDAPSLPEVFVREEVQAVAWELP